MTYRMNTVTGAIHCPDGTVISPPYDAPEYQDYAAWIGAGNKPEEFSEDAAPAAPAIDLSTMSVADLLALSAAINVEMQKALG